MEFECIRKKISNSKRVPSSTIIFKIELYVKIIVINYYALAVLRKHLLYTRVEWKRKKMNILVYCFYFLWIFSPVFDLLVISFLRCKRVQIPFTRSRFSITQTNVRNILIPVNYVIPDDFTIRLLPFVSDEIKIYENKNDFQLVVTRFNLKK